MAPAQETVEIFAVQRVGEYVQFTLIAPTIATGFAPGQFVTVAVGGENSALGLRRTFFVAGATSSAQYAGTVQLVVADRGPGSRWLMQRQVGERLELLGPLGTAFPLPAGPSPAVLIGDSYGSAPLIPLAQALIAQGSPIEIVLGAARADRLYGELTAKRLAGRITITTDDGSGGVRGRATDALSDAIARIGAEVVYAGGPLPMLRVVADIAQQHAIRAQVAVEAPMACGIGVCLSCVLPVRGSGADGRSRFVRSCVEGPVFEAGRVRWADVGRLPGDLAGAAAMGTTGAAATGGR